MHKHLARSTGIKYLPAPTSCILLQCSQECAFPLFVNYIPPPCIQIRSYLLTFGKIQPIAVDYVLFQTFSRNVLSLFNFLPLLLGVIKEKNQATPFSMQHNYKYSNSQKVLVILFSCIDLSEYQFARVSYSVVN